jgi:hypothetical protein
LLAESRLFLRAGRTGTARRALLRFLDVHASALSEADARVHVRAWDHLLTLARLWLTDVGDAALVAGLLRRFVYSTDRSLNDDFVTLACGTSDALEHDLLGGRIYLADIPVALRWNNGGDWLPARLLPGEDGKVRVRVGEWRPDAIPEAFVRDLPAGLAVGKDATDAMYEVRLDESSSVVACRRWTAPEHVPRPSVQDALRELERRLL